MKTRSQEIASDVAALLRARNPLLWIVTREEARVEGYLFAAADAAKLEPITWDIVAGCCDRSGEKIQRGDVDPGATLTSIFEVATNPEAVASRALWIMRDLPIWIGGPPGASLLRQMRNLARALPGAPIDRTQAVIVLSPSREVPAELANHATVIEWPLPDREEIGEILDAAMASVGDRAEPLNGKREAAIDAVVGLSGEEAQACFAKSLVQLKRIDPVAAGKEKKRVIARERVLEWYDPLPGGLGSVGGLENLKAWLAARASAFTPAAKAYGLPAPKGFLLVGVPGCGKSLTAKAVATAWQCPLIRMDLGALKSKFVGESEANLRKAFDVIAALGRCVVWLDEIEKALQGSEGALDGGVSSDALGAILNWMQERQGEAFVIATANNVEGLPPELLRKGRFDEIFFVDLPNAEERVAILETAIRANGRDVYIDTSVAVQACDGFTGSEIASLVPEAMFTAFADGAREITADDIRSAAAMVAPLAKTMPEKIRKVQSWAKERGARTATKAIASAPVAKAGRVIDMDDE